MAEKLHQPPTGTSKRIALRHFSSFALYFPLFFSLGFAPYLTTWTGIHSTEMRIMENDDHDKKPEGVAVHLLAVIAGVVMMVFGVGLGVTMVLLPIGIPLGLIGLMVFIWGLTPGMRKK
jgi:hypothetical protein